jgi:catechol 2,3-dioxygenase-like lactoylglutathione lyase family enzyme
MFDEALAREFYLDFLGFKVDWSTARGQLPAVHAGLQGRLPAAPLRPFRRLLARRRHPHRHHGRRRLSGRIDRQGVQHARPGVEEVPWGGREMSIKDPAGNRLTFYNRTPEISA